MHEHELRPTLSDAQFQDRFIALHRQLWVSHEFAFNDVTAHVFTPPKNMCQVDHSFLHDGQNWHLYYCTGDVSLIEPWLERRRAGDIQGADDICVEPGNGHAVGPTLFDLEFVENVFLPRQGTFDEICRTAGSLLKYQDRYGLLYIARGGIGDRLCLAWSDDLYSWRQDDRNPLMASPEWANPRGACKDPHVMPWEGIYLIYYVVWDKAGLPCVALVTTEDWHEFHDQGPVFRAAPKLRGTFGIESPQVILRDDLWHLFFTQGEGLWHAVSPSPTAFLDGESTQSTRVSRGAYMVGSFHATEIVQDADRWYLTTDRKEEQRRLNRIAGRKMYRSEYIDEKPLEEGLYLAEITWQGDQPILKKPA